MNIAFIGLGNMGGKMAHNLLKAGLKVYGYDLSEVAIQHFAGQVGWCVAARRMQLNKQMWSLPCCLRPSMLKKFTWVKMVF